MQKTHRTIQLQQSHEVLSTKKPNKVYDCSGLDNSGIFVQPDPECKTLASSSSNKWMRMNKKIYSENTAGQRLIRAKNL